MQFHATYLRTPTGRSNRTTLPLRRAFTLLELILSLGLMAVVLMAISMAVDLHLRRFDSRRDFLEESQLARSILRIIADDIRSVVVPYEQDVSVLQSMVSGEVADAAADFFGGDSPEGDSGQPGGDGGDSGGRSGSGGDGGGAVSPETQEPAGDDLLDGEASANTQDLGSTVTLPTKPGIYGNQYELQLDISRLPRADQFQTQPTEMGFGLNDVPSDVKTITYYVIAGEGTVAADELFLLSDLTQSKDPTVVGRGLVRRELDRSVTQWAVNNGNATGLQQQGEVLAPEVLGLEFLYFDGLEWLTEWDTESEGKLPLAIQVVLSMESRSGTSFAGPMPSNDPLATGNVQYYRMVVHLPTASEAAEEDAAMAEAGL